MSQLRSTVEGPTAPALGTNPTLALFSPKELPGRQLHPLARRDGVDGCAQDTVVGICVDVLEIG